MTFIEQGDETLSSSNINIRKPSSNICIQVQSPLRKQEHNEDMSSIGKVDEGKRQQ